MRFVVKVLSRITVLNLSLILFLIDMIAKLYSYVAGAFYLLIGVCLLLALISKQWNAIVIFGILIAVSLLVFWGIAEIIIVVERMKDRLRGF